MKNLQVVTELKKLYKEKVLPFEKQYKYDIFYSPPMSDAEFDSKPHILIIGQYSVGKTTLIKKLLGKEYPDMKIGPEPSTDKFVAVMHDNGKRLINDSTPGNVLAVSDSSSYKGLEKFGISFLNHFVGVYVSSDFLEEIILIDTPGVLAGDKDHSRGYNFPEVTAWFASRADLILLMFDVNKVNISDELKTVIDSCNGNHDKIRCIVNKAEQLSPVKLMRVYGSLMWYLGKAINRPEVPHVYLGNFYNATVSMQDVEPSIEVIEPVLPGAATQFDIEEEELMKELHELPKRSIIKKIDDLVKRIRMLRVHACLLSYLREEMPLWIGRATKKAELIQSLDKVYNAVAVKYNLPLGDFPNKKEFQAKLEGQDFCSFDKFTPKMMKDFNAVLEQDIPRLMETLLQDSKSKVDGVGDGLFVESLESNSSSSSNVCHPTATSTTNTMQWVAEGAASMLPHWLKPDQTSRIPTNKPTNKSALNSVEPVDLYETMSDTDSHASEDAAKSPIARKRKAEKVSSSSTTAANLSAIPDEGMTAAAAGITDEDSAWNINKRFRLF